MNVPVYDIGTPQLIPGDATITASLAFSSSPRIIGTQDFSGQFYMGFRFKSGVLPLRESIREAVEIGLRNLRDYRSGQLLPKGAADGRIVPVQVGRTTQCVKRTGY